MRKRLTTIALTGVLAMPVAAGAGAGPTSNAELEAKIEQLTRDFNKEITQLRKQIQHQDEKFERIDEKAEAWDLASRIQLSGDLRARLDVHQADTVAYYPATRVGQGVYDFIDVANTMNNNTVLAGFGLNTASPVGAPGVPGTMLGNLGPALAGGASAFIPAAMGAGLTSQQATDAYALFSNANAGALVSQFGAAGYTVAQLLGAMSTPQNLASLMQGLPAADRASIFSNMYNNYLPNAASSYENDTLWTTRFRMNLRAKATENVEIKARLVGYKTWGMQDSVTPETNESGIHDTDSPYFLNSRSFDGTSGRQPVNNMLVVDRAFVNWNNIAEQPVWFSIGRRPTTDGPPAQLRQGLDERQATPVAFMDYPFDGISVGYAYNTLFGRPDSPGRIRFCYGRGFEAGVNQKDTGINDVDFAGVSWDVYQKGNRFLTLQSFGAFNLFNVPGDTYFPNPLEMAQATQGLLNGSLTYDPTTGEYLDNGGATLMDNTFLDRQNMGNVFHTSGVYMDKYRDLNYFLALGWSHTDPSGVDEMGISLLGDFWSEPEARDGYAFYLGGRYDIPNSPFKIGAEYNHGTKYWLGFTPGHDDMYASKLYTRGSVYEIYGIYDIPGGEAISKFGKAFIRLGYQHFDYDYTYSGMWLGAPTAIEDIKSDPLTGQFYTPTDSIDQVYMTFEAHF